MKLCRTRTVCACAVHALSEGVNFLVKVVTSFWIISRILFLVQTQCALKIDPGFGFSIFFVSCIRMANLADCEKRVIEALISVFSKTLNNCSLAESNESEVVVIEKVLQVLLAQNESLYSDVDGNSNGRGIMMSILEDQEFMPYGENTTSVINLLDDGGKSTNPTEVGTTSEKRLRQLEIIKVFVLIFVISIILFTTCRMVFQLFIRFRPEKPPLA